MRGTLADARATQVKLRAEAQAPAAGSQTLTAYLDTWLAGRRKSLSAQSVVSYERIIHYWTCALGEVRIGDLTAERINATITDAMADIGAVTARGRLWLLRSALEAAVDLEMLPRNPAAKVRIKGSASAKRIPTPEEMRRIIDAAQDDPAVILLELPLYVGMRPGEAGALAWSDVRVTNESEGVCSIGKTVQQLLHGTVKHGTKTGGSREAPLGRLAIAALARQMARQMAMREKYGAEWNPQDLVYCPEPGGRFMPHGHDFLARICKAAGVPAVTWHALRHYNISLLIDAGVSPRSVADAVGHVDAHMTLNVYAHRLSPSLAALAAVIDRELLG